MTMAYWWALTKAYLKIAAGKERLLNKPAMKLPGAGQKDQCMAAPQLLIFATEFLEADGRLAWPPP
jgi:hypothetical protein